MKKYKMEICSCGYSENYHYRSVICNKFKKNGKYFLDKINGNNLVRINANDFVVKKTQEKCLKYQCGKGRVLHDMGMFDHKYEPSRVYEYRDVNLTITENFPCYYKDCEQKHDNKSHTPVVFVKVENVTEDDSVCIKADRKVIIVTDETKIPPEPNFDAEKEERENEQSRVFDSEIHFGISLRDPQTSLQRKINENIKNLKETYPEIEKFVNEKIVGQPYDEAKRRFAEIGMNLWHVAYIYSSIFSSVAVIPNVDSNNCITSVTFHSIKTCSEKLKKI